MIDLSHLRLNDEELPEMSHEFEIDLNTIVTANRAFALEGMQRELNENLARASDREDILYVERLYDDLRRAANSLAVVALVTRFKHWITKFVRRLPSTPKDYRQQELHAELQTLSKALGSPRIPDKFFTDMEEFRNSVIHADSRAEWTHGKKKKSVVSQYRNAYGEVEISDEQLADAVARAIEQIKWYEGRLNDIPSQAHC
jgi:hypothetical protein